MIGDGDFEPILAFLGRVDRAFLGAYIDATDVPLLPKSIHVALLEELAALTAGEYADEPDANLRQEILLGYYDSPVGIFCRYLETAIEPDVGIYVEGDPR